MENRILDQPAPNSRITVRPFEQRQSLPQYFYPFLSPLSDTADANRIGSFAEELQTTTRPGDLASVYIHIPFCRNVCFFCPMYKTRLPEEAALSGYVNQLIREIKAYAELTYVKKLRIGGVYVGGGSPSLFPPKLTKRLLQAVADHLPLIDGCEITVEGEVRTLNDPERLETLANCGCTRVSFGVQSFNSFVRRKANLRPKMEEIENCTNQLRSAGFNINMDMMFGLPGQTLEIWKRDLLQAVEMGANQLDCYDTVIYPNAMLFRLRHKYKPLMVSEVDKIAMYDYALNFLPAQGLKQRTNAIFAKDEKGFRLPSLLSSEGTYEIVAIGDSAIGYLNGTAYRNISPLEEYMVWSEDRKLPIRLLHTLTREEVFVKRMLSFCRLLHVKKVELGPDILEFMRPTLDDLVAREVLEEDEEALWLTRLGRTWYDNVFLSFIPSQQRQKMWKIMY